MKEEETNGNSRSLRCNERGVEGFLSAVDPRQWLNGISSPTEAITMAVEVAIIACLSLMFILVCTKCFIPLLRCSISVAKPPKK
uniref:Transmembrane protein n=1 Tax=Angiostrongylus cantonensis TaxID=6313 RepID=A0A0K0CW62_ANGCA